jgi:Flp pilus assembly pilin Flp
MLVGPGRPANSEATGVIDLIFWFRHRLLSGQRGQGLAEYALILALIAVISIAALVFLGTRISGILSTIGARI